MPGPADAGSSRERRRWPRPASPAVHSYRKPPGEEGTDTTEEEGTDTHEDGTDTDGGGGGEDEPSTGPEEKDPTPADCEPETIDEDITADTTWSASDCPRVAIDGNVHVTDGATLTIEPGVEVIARVGSRLTVTVESTLVASGDPEDPVWFHGEENAPGYWEGIRLRSSTANEIDNAIIKHGGANDWANVNLDNDDSRVSITNVLSERSKTAGLVAEDGTTLSAFETNEFNENEDAAVRVQTAHLGSLDEESSHVGDNCNDVIQVSSSYVERDATWPATDAPYRFAGENHDITEAAVTVAPGASFLFDAGAMIKVHQNGSLTAEGTSDAEITFEGATATAGYWAGLRLRSNDPANSFDNVLVAHGGANDWANIYLDDSSQASVTNSTLRKSATGGLYAEQGTRLTTSSNTFEDNAKGDVKEPGG